MLVEKWMVAVRENGEIPQTGRQRIPDSWSKETERTVADRFEIAFVDFQKFLAWGSEEAWSLILAERSWKVRVECTVEVTVGKSYDLVFPAEFHRQPKERWLKIKNYGCNNSQQINFWEDLNGRDLGEERVCERERERERERENSGNEGIVEFGEQDLKIGRVFRRNRLWHSSCVQKE